MNGAVVIVAIVGKVFLDVAHGVGHVVGGARHGDGADGGDGPLGSIVGFDATQFGERRRHGDVRQRLLLAARLVLAGRHVTAHAGGEGFQTLRRRHVLPPWTTLCRQNTYNC